MRLMADQISKSVAIMQSLSRSLSRFTEKSATHRVININLRHRYALRMKTDTGALAAYTPNVSASYRLKNVSK